MAEIIKLTESQLKDIVTKVIMQERMVNEQVTDPNVNPRIRKIFDDLNAAVVGPGTQLNLLVSTFQQMQSSDDFYTISRILKANQKTANLPYGSIVSLLDGELDSQDLTTATAIQAVLAKIGVTLTFQSKAGLLVPNSFQFGGSPVKTAQTATAGNDPYATTRKMTCVTFAAGQNKADVVTSQTTQLTVFNNGRVFSKKSGKKGYWQCNPKNACTIDFVFDGEPEVKYSETMVGCKGNGGGGKKSNWVKNNGFPLKYGQYGDLIKQLQATIGAQTNDSRVYDGYFGNKTEALVKAYYPNYDRATGVTQEMFNTRPTNPMDKTKFNTNLNRFNTQPPAGGTPPVAGAPVTK
jgi:hypothetical protein